MQQVGLCHYDLSLESVLLRGSDSYIVGLGMSIRVPMTSEGAHTPRLLSPQAYCGTNLLYLAPELLQNVPFDGHAVDLWAVGVMLAIMLYGTGAPFVWASPDDKRYRDIAIKGNLRGVARKWESRNHGVSPISDEALDLLQSMLRANPADRLTLEEIQQHPWFLAEATPPQMSASTFNENLG
jgi:serine/threonine-protein kinase SRK2